MAYRHSSIENRRRVTTVHPFDAAKCAPPIQIRRIQLKRCVEVMNTVDTTDHRKMCIELLKLRESGKLPAGWNPVLDDYYGRFF